MLRPRHWPAPPRVALDPTYELSLRVGLRRRDRAALEAVFRLYWPSLLSQARAVLPTELDPEDAAAEVLLYLVRWAGSFDPQRAIYPWLARICLHVCARRHRLRPRARRAPAPVGADGNAEALGAPEAPSGDVDRVLARALGRLTARLRQVIALRYLFGLTTTEISELLDLDAAAVTKALYRALHALRTGPEAHELRGWLEHWGNSA